jgi:hypothetical protein
VFGYEDDLPGSHRFGDGDPLIGVELRWVGFRQWGGMIVVFAILPSARIEAEEHRDFHVLPGNLCCLG